MQRYFGAVTIVLLVGMVWGRVALLKRRGIKAMRFGETDKQDLLIAPFALFYFYLVLGGAFPLPGVSRRELFQSGAASWVGVALCGAGLLVLLLSLMSFGQSFRVGIDREQPDELVTTGVFAWSRNPIYVAFGLVLLGQFLVFPNWLLLVFVVAGVGLFHRQVRREERALRAHYGEAYAAYCARVRRYL
jgi:protein-S-isoprenylcysteine O-methyltransferase Ste14